jgi:LacI family transcriptional regulator
MSSIYKVAEFAGVSVATVSRVLNNKGYVSDKTRIKVEEASRALHYTLNQNAHSLSTSNTKLIGLLVPDINNPIYLEQAKGIIDFLKDKGYNLILTESGDSDEDLSSIVRRFLGNRVEGIIMTSRDFSLFDNMDDIIEPAVYNHVPIVLNGYLNSKFEVDKCSIDSVRGAYLATEHLIKLGHSRIGLIAGTDCLSARERQEGYFQALIDNHISFDEELIVRGDFRQHSGYIAMKQLLNKGNQVTAVFAMNDLMAIGALIALEELGKNVPEDMAVVGFDDINWCSIIRPRLTSVVQPKYETGRKLAEMLYDRITGEYDGPARHQIYTPRLAIRQSTVSMKAHYT